MYISNFACDRSKPKYNIKLIRILRGITIKDAAKQIGVSSSTLSRYERNPKMMPVKMAKSLLRYYDFPLDDCDFF